MISSSLCSPFRVLLPPCSHKNLRFLIFLHSKRKINFVPRFSSSIPNDDSLSVPKPIPLGYDPSEELYGLGVDIKPRNIASGTPEQRSWFGPNGQYIRELPCPSCRGRGYTPCTECGIERSRSDCSLCNGKGIMTCRRCLGDRVIWEESIDEQPWEKARSISPLRMKEDEEVDNLDIKLKEKKKSKRVYQSPPPEVGLKISRSLKSLNAKTGLFSKRMKIIHRDPTLHAQRVAAIKKAKGTAAARKRASDALKAFFSDPENRRRRSIAMKGVKFYCKNCGREGHRRHYCPELKDILTDRRSKCRVCGEKGHNRRTCQKSKLDNKTVTVKRHHQCKICGKKGHNSRTCPMSGSSNRKNIVKHRRCGICRERGHSRRKCPGRMGFELIDEDRKVADRRGTYTCSLCGEKGHNLRACPKRNVYDLEINPLINGN